MADSKLRNQAAWPALGPFLADGRFLAWGATRFTLRLWDARTGRTRITWVCLNAWPIAVSPEGHFRCAPAAKAELVYVVQTAAARRR